MTVVPPLARGLFVTLLGFALAGCISLFPKEKPAQLYRFGVSRGPITAPGSLDKDRFAVQSVPTSFDRAAAGDAILTVTGDQAAYIKGARWVTSATSMFDAAVAHAFDADKGPARLIARGEAVRPDYTLKLDVRAFEARYDRGAAAAPTVVVEVYAALSKASDRTLAGERIFQAKVGAGENTTGGITTAFDQATAKALGELVAWVDGKGAG
ncbi:MAG: ABC-type transport auxiliary lipoprotein family protein [Pseudomonadota bacterium]